MHRTGRRCARFGPVTAYDKDGYFIANPISRYAIGDRDPLKFNPDRSLILDVQNQNPGAHRTMDYWLPSGDGTLISRFGYIGHRRRFLRELACAAVGKPSPDLRVLAALIFHGAILAPRFLEDAAEPRPPMRPVEVRAQVWESTRKWKGNVFHLDFYGRNLFTDFVPRPCF